ncbi:MAG TPA: hypothetical protein DEP23_13530 [Ruminococcaceae bacterium]|nr:hypothetical protein [Oscillospiraceae bacterium]
MFLAIIFTLLHVSAVFYRNNFIAFACSIFTRLTHQYYREVVLVFANFSINLFTTYLCANSRVFRRNHIIRRNEILKHIKFLLYKHNKASFCLFLVRFCKNVGKGFST